jgi:hypothetical protein
MDCDGVRSLRVSMESLLMVIPPGNPSRPVHELHHGLYHSSFGWSILMVLGRLASEAGVVLELIPTGVALCQIPAAAFVIG